MIIQIFMTSKVSDEERTSTQEMQKAHLQRQGKICIQKSEINSQRSISFFSLFEKVKKIPLYKLKKTQILFIHVSFAPHHRAPLHKKEKKIFP